MSDQLLDAIREARPDFEDLPDGREVLERVLGAGRGGRSTSRFRRGAPVALAIGATLAVVAVGVLSLRGHTPAPRGGAHPGGSGAVRGEIVDRDGRVLAANANMTTRLEIDPSKLPRSQSARTAALKRLAAVLGVKLPAREGKPAPGFAELLRSSLRPSVTQYLSRHRADFPEVKLVRVSQRVYHDDAAAQLLTRSGLEVSYNRDLHAGDTLKTTLDTSLETTGEQALQHAIDANPSARGGGFVALDPDNGQVYAMGSLPTYNPNVFGRPITAPVWRELTGPDHPLLNRPTEVAGSVGSAFAPITAIAALESGAWATGETYDDTGQYCFEGQCRHNAGGAVDGTLGVQSALKIGSNDFFYNLGVLTNSPAAAGGALQDWARELGVGSRSGIDLPGESSGTLPSPAWLARIDHRPWSAGDNESLAVGQGDVQVTPLQLAVAYAAIENGGTVVRPHLGLAVERPDGSLIRSIDPSPVRHLKMGAPDLASVRVGLRLASSQPGGTSADVFSSFPAPVYGETGAAQYAGQQDHAWYAGFVPATDGAPPIVVVVTVEQGGFGDVAAAPVARQIFSQWLFGRPGPWVAGTSRTR